MPDYVFVAGTRWPSIYGTAEAPAGTPVDITGKTVRLVLTRVGEDAPTLDVAGTVVAPGTAGTMRYDWANGEPPAVGHYLAQWEVTFSAGVVGIFPSDGPLTLDVVQDLGAPSTTPRGYTTPAQVAAELGQSFSSAQNAQCLELIAAAEDWIDWYTGRVWAASEAVTDERIPLYGSEVYLSRYPLASITSVKVRPSYVGATLTTLVADTDYSLLDAQRGILRLAYLYDDPAELLVSYVPSAVPPARIGLGCAKLVAHWMGSSIEGLPSGIKKYSVGGELSVELTDGSTGGVPDDVLRLIGPRRTVFA